MLVFCVSQHVQNLPLEGGPCITLWWQLRQLCDFWPIMSNQWFAHSPGVWSSCSCSCWPSQQLRTRHCPLCSYVSPAVIQSLWKDVHWKLINFCCILPTWKTKSIQQYQVLVAKNKKRAQSQGWYIFNTCLIHDLSAVYVSIPRCSRSAMGTAECFHRALCFERTLEDLTVIWQQYSKAFKQRYSRACAALKLGFTWSLRRKVCVPQRRRHRHPRPQLPAARTWNPTIPGVSLQPGHAKGTGAAAGKRHGPRANKAGAGDRCIMGWKESHWGERGGKKNKGNSGNGQGLGTASPRGNPAPHLR